MSLSCSMIVVCSCRVIIISNRTCLCCMIVVCSHRMLVCYVTALKPAMRRCVACRHDDKISPNASWHVNRDFFLLGLQWNHAASRHYRRDCRCWSNVTALTVIRWCKHNDCGRTVGRDDMQSTHSSCRRIPFPCTLAWVSDRAIEWARRSAQAKLAVPVRVRSEQMSEWCKRMEERMAQNNLEIGQNYSTALEQVSEWANEQASRRGSERASEAVRAVKCERSNNWSPGSGTNISILICIMSCQRGTRFWKTWILYPWYKTC